MVWVCGGKDHFDAPGIGAIGQSVFVSCCNEVAGTEQCLYNTRVQYGSIFLSFFPGTLYCVYAV